MPPAALLVLLLSAGAFAAEPAALPDAQLLRLEAELTQKLEARNNGALPPDQYRRYAEKFRGELDAALAQAPETPVNRGRHAMILSRLDENGPGQAMAGLDRALESEPGSAELLIAKGSILLQQGDHAGALASADEVLKGNAERGEDPDPAAVSLRYFSTGRGAPTRGNQATAPAPPDPGGRQTIQFTQREARSRVEVPSISGDPEAREDGNDVPGFNIGRAHTWTKGKIESAQQGFVRWVGRKVGFRPGEEEAALNGSMDGAILGTGIGVVVGTVGGGLYCSPGAVTGAPYLMCILAGGAGGVIVGSSTGAVIGGTFGVIKKRASVEYDKAQGKETASE